MIVQDDEAILDGLVAHVRQQLERANLSNGFDLGVATDTKPSMTLDIVWKNKVTFEALGMQNYVWRADGMLSKLDIGDEKLIISIVSTD